MPVSDRILITWNWCDIPARASLETGENTSSPRPTVRSTAATIAAAARHWQRQRKRQQ
jgi:hypothetical protein